MKQDDPVSSFERLEFWAVTVTFVFTLPTLIIRYNTSFATAGYDADVRGLVEYSGGFLSFLYWNFRIMPEILRRERLARNTWLMIGLAAFVFAVYVGAAFFSYDFHAYIDLRRSLISTLVISLAFLGYFLVKQFALFILSRAADIQRFFTIFNRDGLVVLGLWMVVTYFIAVVNVPAEAFFAWLTVIPTGIILHGVAFYYFIPRSLKWKYPLVSYFFKIIIYCFVTGFAVMLFVLVITGDEQRSFPIGLFIGLVHFFLTAPALWLIYRWQMQGKAEIYALRSELGRSAANLDSLRSQINPHFLFNALNTIYGLAIQEKAERTSESIEKLGDMMRFMLSENMQERIPLKRELEYLDSYVSLQKLRTDSNAGLRIRVDIQQEIDPAVRITPMLLIPFVENAFKHGISMREESYIQISLELKKTTLYFDVSNSKHLRSESDPEKDSNGIGLANVRLRLQHVYPDRHELLIRETNGDFFVHLRIELD